MADMDQINYVLTKWQSRVANLKRRNIEFFEAGLLQGDFLMPVQGFIYACDNQHRLCAFEAALGDESCESLLLLKGDSVALIDALTLIHIRSVDIILEQAQNTTNASPAYVAMLVDMVRDITNAVPS